MALQRCKALTEWTMRASQLKEQDKVYKEKLPPHMKPLMQKKRLLLFQEMLDSVDYPDKSLVQDLTQGFNILGWQFSVSTLKQMAGFEQGYLTAAV